MVLLSEVFHHENVTGNIGFVLRSESAGHAFIGSGSVAHKICARRPGPSSDVLVYFGAVHSHERRGRVVHQASLVTPQAVVLFCDTAPTVKQTIKYEDEDWKILQFPGKKMTIHLPSEEADLLLNLRGAIGRTFEFYIDQGDISKIRNVPRENVKRVEEIRQRMLEIIASMLNKAEDGMIDADIDSSCD